MTRVAVWLQRILGIEGLDAPENRSVVRAGFILAALAMVIRIVFWAYTQRYWEDALITCLHSENSVRGLGLTHFRVNEPPLHGFTSPLSVLIPLLGDLIHVGFGLELLKLVSIPAGALAVLYLLGIGLHPGVRLPGPLLGLAMGYAAFEHHQILWGMSGMETQLAVTILLMSMYYVIAWKPVPLGISLGLCMLARPDFAFWTIIVGFYALFKERRQLLRIVPAALALYLPWVVFTTLYYGSPVPHTLVAKSTGYPIWYDGLDQLTLKAFADYTWVRLAGHLQAMLGPAFCGHGAFIHVFFSSGYVSPVGFIMSLFTLTGMAVILIRRRTALWPVVFFAFVYTLYFVYLVPILFGWYKVPFLAVLVLLGACGIQAVTGWLRPRWRQVIQCSLAVAYIGLFVGVLPRTFLTERQIQRDVEDPVRKAAGLYLRDRMKPEEAVGGEPLGYMAYYSRGNVYDWPGLDSRTVVQWSREHPGERSLENMLDALRPEYLFLRDAEMLYVFKDPGWIRRDYHVVQTFLIDPEAAKKIRWLDLNIDTQYRLYKKNRPEDAQPDDDRLWPCAPPINVISTPKLYQYGMTLARQKRYPEAAAHFERLLELKPDDAQAMTRLAEVFVLQGEKERARPIVEKLRKMGDRAGNL